MFCIKCGQRLPEDALFCSNCGTETIHKQNAYLKEVIPTNSTFLNEEIQIQKELSERKRKEKLEESNIKTRKTLSDALENTKQAKTTRVMIFSSIAGIAALVAFISISSILSDQRLTIELLTTASMSFAVALGVLGGTGIVCYQYNKIIREKEMELKRFDEEIKTSKEDF